MLLPKHERSFNDRGQSFGNISGLNGYKFWGRTVSNLIRPKGVYELGSKHKIAAYIGC